MTEQGAITLVTEQKQMDRAVRAFASNVTERMTVSVSELSETADLGEFSLHDQNLQGSQTELPIDLYKMGSFIAADSAKDQIAGTLYRLIGITDVARTVYQRNRTFVDSISVSFESGLTLSYPAGVTTGKQDPRESDWYFRTIERGATSWFTKGEAVNRRSVTTPVQTSSGQIVGVARITIRTDALLTKSINPTHLPPEASAYLIAVPDDEPQLLPNEVAVLEANTGNWRVHDLMRPMLLDGDDAWLKVASDIRSGVPGMEFVTRSGVREAWSFGPLWSNRRRRMASRRNVPRAGDYERSRPGRSYCQSIVPGPTQECCDLCRLRRNQCHWLGNLWCKNVDQTNPPITRSRYAIGNRRLQYARR